MTQTVKTPRVNAVYVVKNEWPLLGVAISHALTHYAEKVLIIDTGSKDGIFEGIKALQSFWTGRIELFRCNQEVFDQTPLTNLLIEMSKQDKADWTMVLDADEFFVHENYPEFLMKLFKTDEKWSAFAIKVVNFIVDEEHEDSNLDAFGEIKYRVAGQNSLSATDSQYPLRVLAGEIPLQFRNTPDKMLVRNSNEVFLSQGNHQLVFGNGIWWEKHDSSVSSASFLGGMICHLPHTSEQRLLKRKDRNFFDQQKTTFRLNVDNFRGVTTSELRKTSVLHQENREKWLESDVIVANNVLAHSLAPVIQRIEKIWPKLIDASYNSEAENSFPDALDIKIMSKLIRKYHSRAEKLWNEGRHGE